MSRKSEHTRSEKMIRGQLRIGESPTNSAALSGPIFCFWYGNRQWFKFKGFVSIVIMAGVMWRRVRVPLNIGADVELMFELLCYFDLYSPIDWI